MKQLMKNLAGLLGYNLHLTSNLICVGREARTLRPHLSRCQVRLEPSHFQRVVDASLCRHGDDELLFSAGSHMLPSYYSMRRPFISDADFSNKQFSPDVYSSTLAGKPLACESSTMTSYSSLIDSYYPEAFGDYRSATTFSTSGGSFLPSSALSSLLPNYGGESSHLFLVRWGQDVSRRQRFMILVQCEVLVPTNFRSTSVCVTYCTFTPPYLFKGLINT